MSAVSLRSSSYGEERPLAQRAAALAIALAVNALLILMLLGLATFSPQLPKEAKPLAVFDVLPGNEPAPRRAARVAHSGGKPAPRTRTPAQPQPVKAATVASPLPANAFKNLLSFSPSEVAATDKALLAGRDAGQGGSGTGTAAGSGEESASAGVVGRAPGGEPLYNAEWYRRPTAAEMDSYLPKSLATTSWGEVACRTIPNWGVEDCAELDESPAGSGMSRALRQAAWQFKVRPPRIGGRSLVGAWVRIRYTLTLDRRGASGGTSG